MYRINYIILAHKNPLQLRRLIENLSDADVYFYIHIDKNANFEFKLDACSSLKIINSTACSWGDFSLVAATLKCIEQIISDHGHGHTILLSGQDFPIINKKAIRAYLENNKIYNFMDCLPIKDAWPNHYKYRTQAYKYNFSGNISDSVYIPSIFSFRPKAIYRNAKKILIRSITEKKIDHLKALKKIFLYKKPPKKITFYGGSQWWAINDLTLRKLFEYLKNNSDLIEFFENAVIPDEVFFQTAIMKIKNDGEDILLKPSLTYTSWKSKFDDSPEILTINHYETIQEASKRFLFARKFDDFIDSSIINSIEAKLKSSENK